MPVSLTQKYHSHLFRICLQVHEQSSEASSLYPQALGLYGNWLAESKSENPTTIIEDYLEKVRKRSTGDIYRNLSRCLTRSCSGEQRWRSGENTRLSPMWPGFDSRTRRHMWVEVEFVVGSHPCSERFFSHFPISSKTNISKFHCLFTVVMFPLSVLVYWSILAWARKMTQKALAWTQAKLLKRFR